MSLSGGLTLSCSTDRSAGLQELYLIDVADFTSAAFASGSTSNFGTITLGSGATWKKFEFEQDQAEFRENIEGERQSYKVTHEIEIYLPGMNETNRNAIQEILDNSPCGFVAAVKDNNGVTWLVGYSSTHGTNRPVRLLTSEGTTAKALGEVNGDTLTLQSIDTTKACKTSASIVTS